ncbi:MAG: dipeptidase [Myxococcales bacterium]|nr:dipeptidase [Myxococcales bacterium]
MCSRLSTYLCVASLALVGCERAEHEAPRARWTKRPAPEQPKTAAELLDRAQALAHRVIILDGHVDVPYRLEESRDADGQLTEDVSSATPRGDFDLPRARAGGLDAPFMSIYVPAAVEEAGGAKALADRLIDMVEDIARSSDGFALARSPADVRTNFAAGKISLALGMENGGPLEGDLRNLEHFHARGVRYITLTHARDNHISDSSFDDRHTHGGLSPFGHEVVAAMNRLGVMIDVSHVSDDAFWQVVARTEAPVIASHSSCRRFTPGWERNMSDDMIRALAAVGGVIQINFGSSFLDDEVRRARESEQSVREQLARDEHLDGPALDERLAPLQAAQPRRYATVGQVADHIEHVIWLVGVDHVGLGSDFDGVGDSLPAGLKDVSMYPNLFAELLARGHSEEDLEKIAGGNVLRVWEAVEAVAARHRAAPTIGR